MKIRQKRSYPKLDKVMPVTIATVKHRRKWQPSRFIFTTPYQDEVENLMGNLGYGCEDYCLWEGVVIAADNVPMKKLTKARKKALIKALLA